MVDATQTKQDDKKTSGGSIGSDGITIDKNKSAEQYMKEAEEKYIIPNLVREEFPDLVKLIFETESMNAEEREYWLQIMPIMTEDQIVKFREILVNERDQLEKLDQEYKQEISKISGEKNPEINEEEIKKKMEKIKELESKSEETEKGEEEELLSKLKDL